VRELGKFVVGVDLGGTKIYTALADESGRLLAETRVATGAGDGQEAVFRRIACTVAEVCASGGSGVNLCALGIGVPGLMDPATGIVDYAPNLRWRNVPVREILQENMKMPVLVDNDANLAALGEHKFGAGAGVQNMVYVTVSTGIGGGLIQNGEVYHGVSGTAGELGHMVIDPAGPLCGCGRRGCLEALASGTAMAVRARELVAAGSGKAILREAGGRAGDIDARSVAAAAAGGDGEAGEILREAGRALGMGLANVVNLINPAMVVLGGGAMNVGPLLWDAMLQELKVRAMAGALVNLRVVPASLGQRSGLMGAVALALEKCEVRG
jgi:glucokinase